VTLGVVQLPVASGHGKTLVEKFHPYGVIQGFGLGEIVYDAPVTSFLGILAGQAGPGVTFPFGNTFAFQDTFVPAQRLAGTAIALGSADSLSVAATHGPLVVYGKDGSTNFQVTLGTGNSRLDSIRGLVSVYNAGVDILDQNATVKETVRVDPISLSVNGTVRVFYVGQTHLHFHGSDRGNAYDLRATPGSQLIINAGAGNDTFHVSGQGASLDGVGTVVLVAGGGTDSLTVDDSAAGTTGSYDLTRGKAFGLQLTRLQRSDGPAVLAFGVAHVAFNVSDRGSAVRISGNAPGTTLDVHGGAGNDTFALKGVAADAAITLDGGGGVNTLDYSGYVGPAAPAVPSGPGVVLPAGAVNWYKGDGNAADVLGRHGGTLHGGATFGAGKVGAAFRFDGQDSYVQIPNDPDLEPAAVTVEAWVKSEAVAPYAYIVAKGANTNVAASYAMYTGPSGGLVFYIYDGTNAAISPNAGIGVWDGKWHHVAGTFDGSALRLFVDGKEVGTGTPTALKIGYGLPSGNDLSIGKYLGAPNFAFNGFVDELSVYNRALGASEIQGIFAAGGAGKSVAAPPPPTITKGVTVILPLGMATGLGGGVSRIQNLIGSPADDILIGNGGNTIDGGGGRDLLIAGPSASNLFGNGDDLLIGGMTAYDRNLPALDAVLATWSDRGTDYPGRVTKLRNGMLASGKVTSNLQRNTLLGGAGLNLFFASGLDGTNQKAGETVSPL
jgi:hypothetical protein